MTTALKNVLMTCQSLYPHRCPTHVSETPRIHHVSRPPITRPPPAKFAFQVPSNRAHHTPGASLTCTALRRCGHLLPIGLVLSRNAQFSPFIRPFPSRCPSFHWPSAALLDRLKSSATCPVQKCSATPALNCWSDFSSSICLSALTHFPRKLWEMSMEDSDIH